MKTALVHGEARLLSIFSSLDLGKCWSDEVHVRPVNHEHAWVYPGTFGKALKQLAEPHVSGVPWPIPDDHNETVSSAERNLRRISRAFDLLAAAHLAKGWRRRRKRRELLAALPHLGGEDRRRA